MFKLRRRHSPAPLSVRPPAPAAPESHEVTVADAATVARAQHVRAALQQAGMDLGLLASEPGWFAQARTGDPVPVGSTERAELIAHLGSQTTTCVASDEACTKVVEKIEAITVLQEIQAEGATVRSCGHHLSADTLRTIRDIVHQVRHEYHAEQRATDR